MGTRGAMGVRIDGQDKVSYCHFDCYPEGLGQSMVRDIRALLRDPGLDGFRRLARELRLVNETDRASDEDVKLYGKFSDPGVGSRDSHDWYVLLRKLQGELKSTLKTGVMIDNHRFLADSLFCEYAYIVNLDEATFEVYRGFQSHKHDKGRYAGLALVGTFDLADIPSNWDKQAFPDEEEE